MQVARTVAVKKQPKAVAKKKVSKRKVKKFIKYVLGTLIGAYATIKVLKFFWYSAQICFAMCYGIVWGIYMTIVG